VGLAFADQGAIVVIASRKVMALNREAFSEMAPTTFALRRGGLPHEIVGAALYLASEPRGSAL
jgi:hypothetical protein